MTRLPAFALLITLFPVSLYAEQTAPADAVNNFHSALREGNHELIIKLLDPRVVVYEEGVPELSFSDYALYHLKADMEFAKSTTRRIIHTRVLEGQEYFAVLNYGTIKGVFQKAKVDQHFSETMLLKRNNGNWRITHIHWSNNTTRHKNISAPAEKSAGSIFDRIKAIFN